MIETITNSSRTSFLDCPFKYFCEYERRLSPLREAAYFRWGRLVHMCKEAQEKGEDIDAAIQVVRDEAVERAFPPSVLQEVDEMCQLVPNVMDAHLLKWHEMDENYEDLNIESKFEMKLSCGFLFKGRIDKFVRDKRDGCKLLWERKTASSTGDDYWTGKQLDSQPKGYLLAANHAIGFHTNDVMYDIFKKPGIRQKQRQTREQYIEELGLKYLLERDTYFERRQIHFEDTEIQEYLRDLDEVARSIRWHRQDVNWPKHHPGNRKGGCAYQPICLRGDESGFYVREQKEYHPELI